MSDQLTQYEAWIQFNIKKIRELQVVYMENLLFFEKELPEINWNSPQQIKAFFKNSLDVNLKSATISEIQDLQARYHHDSEEYMMIYGVLQVLKLKALLKNYIECILRHAKGGVIFLRKENNIWVMPNKRPLSKAPEILDCVVAQNIE